MYTTRIHNNTNIAPHRAPATKASATASAFSIGVVLVTVRFQAARASAANYHDSQVVCVELGKREGGTEQSLRQLLCACVCVCACVRACGAYIV